MSRLLALSLAVALAAILLVESGDGRSIQKR